MMGSKFLERAILKEWEAHKENYDENGEWFECNIVETDAYCNYGVGAKIITTYAGGGEKTVVLKTKKEADDYSKKEKEKFGGCSVCDRFERLLKVVRKQPEVVRE